MMIYQVILNFYVANWVVLDSKLRTFRAAMEYEIRRFIPRRRWSCWWMPPVAIGIRYSLDPQTSLPPPHAINIDSKVF